MDQGHLFKNWPADAAAWTPEQLNLMRELDSFASIYPGGIQQYIHKGKELLDAESEETDIHALGMPPFIFHSPPLDQYSLELIELERTAARLLPKTVFVLVAGGLGERLGSSRIKVGLPVETATDTTYLEYYLSWAGAVGGGNAAPFVIMTSNDTHDRTLELLAELEKAATAPLPTVHVVKQEQVLCFTDSAAHLATDATGLKLIRKPHGHGDVHRLLYEATTASPGAAPVPLIDSWLAAGFEYLVFLQDTNAAATMTTPISLAVSMRERLDMNFTCIPRLPKEAIGLLCRIQNTPDGPWRVANIEYNVFAEVAKTLTREGGDVASSDSDFSPFPGSVNTLVFKLSSYAEVLRLTKGVVPEFINPKYTDETHRSFSSPARIESLMQDFALLFEDGQHRIGGTVFDRFTYQPVKNSLSAAAKLIPLGSSGYCATTGEAAFYEMQRRRLKSIGVPLSYAAEPEVFVMGGAIVAHLFPIIVLKVSCIGSGALENLSAVFPFPSCIDIGAKSALLVEGRVVIEDLHLRGALHICGPSDPLSPPYVVKSLRVENEGWKVYPLVAEHLSPSLMAEVSEEDRIRGFMLDKSVLKVIGNGADSPSSLSESAKL